MEVAWIPTRGLAPWPSRGSGHVAGVATSSLRQAASGKASPTTAMQGHRVGGASRGSKSRRRWPRCLPASSLAPTQSRGRKPPRPLGWCSRPRRLGPLHRRRDFVALAIDGMGPPPSLLVVNDGQGIAFLLAPRIRTHALETGTTPLSPQAPRALRQHSSRASRPLSLVQIVGRLEIHPQLRRRPKRFRQIERCVSGNAALAFDQFVQARPRPADLLSEGRLGGYRSVQGDWYDRTGLYRARYSGNDVDLHDYTEHLDLPLVSLPCWSHLSREDYAKKCLDVVETIEKDTRERHQNNGTTVLGVPAVLSTDPQRRPNKLKKTPAPLVHAKDPEVRQAMTDRYVAFAARYQFASEAFRDGELDANFPAGSFPPAAPYVERARAPD